MYNNPFWKVKKNLNLGEAKRQRPKNDEKYGAPDEYVTRDGETQRSDLLNDREDEIRRASRAALSAARNAGEGVPSNIADIIKSRNSRKLSKLSNRLIRGPHKTLAKHLGDIARRTGRSPIHPKRRPDYGP